MSGSPHSVVLRKIVGDSAAACSAWTASARHGSSLLDALYNLVERRDVVALHRRLDAKGVPLRGPACCFRGERAAVAANQLNAAETLLIAIVENLYVLLLPF